MRQLRRPETLHRVFLFQGVLQPTPPRSVEAGCTRLPVPEPRYEFLVMAKGGGSANKTFLYQETKAVLNPTRLAPVP